MSGRPWLVVLTVSVGLFASSCDDFEPALAVGSDGMGGPAVYPVTCSPGERIVEVRVEDTGVSDLDHVPKGSLRTLWHVKSTAGYPGREGLQPGTATTLDTKVPWTESLASLPADRYLRVSVDLLFENDHHAYNDEFQVAEIGLRSDTVKALFYGVIPLEQFQSEVVPRACHVDQGLLGEWLEDQPNWVSTILAVLSLLWLPALGGVLWGSIVLTKRTRQRWRERHSASRGPEG